MGIENVSMEKDNNFLKRRSFSKLKHLPSGNRQVIRYKIFGKEFFYEELSLR